MFFVLQTVFNFYVHFHTFQTFFSWSGTIYVLPRKMSGGAQKFGDAYRSMAYGNAASSRNVSLSETLEVDTDVLIWSVSEYCARRGRSLGSQRFARRFTRMFLDGQSRTIIDVGGCGMTQTLVPGSGVGQERGRGVRELSVRLGCLICSLCAMVMRSPMCFSCMRCFESTGRSRRGKRGTTCCHYATSSRHTICFIYFATRRIGGVKSILNAVRVRT